MLKTLLLFLHISAIVLFLCALPSNATSTHPPNPKSRVLKSASEFSYPPFALTRPDGRADGFSVDLLKAIVRAIGFEINFSIGPWHEIKQQLADGELDVLPLVSYSKERDQVYDFTAPYLRMNGSIFIRRGEKTIRGKEDLKDREVIVMRGDIAHEYVINEKISNRLILTDTFEEAFKVLSKGMHDAVIVPQVVGLQIIKKLGISNVIDINTFRETSLKPVETPLSGFEQKYCIAVKNGNKDLLAALNEGLAIVIANGTYDKLYDNWFSPVLPAPKISFSSIVKYLLLAIIPLFGVLAIIGVWYLKREVVKKTKSLQQEIERRIRVENALRESENRYRTFFEQGPDGIVIIDPESAMILEFNDQACRQLGYSREEFASLSLLDIEAKETTEETFLHMQSVQDEGYNDFESIHRTKKGEIKHVHVTVQMVKVAGTIVYQCIFRDISERKKAKEALEESENKFRSFVENASDIIYSITPSGFFMYVSPNWLDIIGEPSEMAIGRSFEDYVHPEDVQLCYDFFNMILSGNEERGEKRRFVEYRVRHKDGSWRWHISKISPLRKESGELISLVGIDRDITELKMSEEALRTIHNQLNSLLNAVPDLLIVIDRDFNIQYTNAKGHDLVVQPDLEKHKKCYGRFKLLDSPCEICVAMPVFDTSKTLEIEMINPADGHAREVRAFPIFGINGEVESVVEYVRDITDRKKAEDEKNKLHAQLLQAQKMESVGRLAGGVAHDFNNILQVILGYSEMALQRVDPVNPLYGDIQEIIKAAERSASLTHQLLAFARKQAISPKILNLNEKVSGMLKMLQRLIGEDIELVWKPGVIWPIEMDPSQIDQILANLSINSRDAISGIGNLTIKTENIVLDKTYSATHAGFVSGEYVMLSVSDNGIGMEKKVLEHLFEPFFTTKEMGKGTGLGLATVYGIVKQNNGFINVYSEPNEGTTVKVYIPRAKVEAVTAVENVEHNPAGGAETILVVEDELSILNFGKAILQRYGYSVIAASSPAEALTLTEQYEGPIHLLITDVVMPQMNGKKLKERIVNNFPDIKVLYMSGYTANVIVHHGVLEERVNFLEKPFSVHTLANKVREVLDKA